ncbi:glycosyl transferase family 28 [Flaviaesturariibacter flavus]|uniref:Glycosyl transferase family 28 n=1 Tax=Flaviaesturariibacter flavus TaxID=2502780 RepID=A0A4R1BQ11_9BACT|nr:glycosyltransferase [Flaviaesturariibacter flavus]TCJ19315.1 glycosyl transferase family 28 [Flaviaesturariibacter flavus]
MNVFVTIGSQEPFSRLHHLVDELAPEFPALRFLAQTTGSDSFRGRHIEVLSFIPPVAFKKHLEEADLVIAHAGIGTILNVLELQKPLIVFPRLGRLHETRDDHQVATARAFEKQGYLHVAEDGPQLRAHLEAFLQGRLPPAAPIAPHASPGLLESLSEFIGK